MRPIVRLTAALGAGTVLAWTVGSCGSEGAGTVAEQARTAVSGATTKAATQPQKTVTQPQKTVTQPAKTVTATRTQTQTQTVTQPAQSNTTTVVQATPTSTTGGGDSNGGDLPWWGWVLITLGVVAIAAGLFELGRRRGRGKPGAPPQPPLG